MSLGCSICLILLLAACGGGGGSSAPAPIAPGILSSITISPPSLYLEATKSYTGLKAIGNYTGGTTADLTSQVVWSSASSAVASWTLGASGVVVTAASSPPATTTITAAFNGLIGSGTVNIVTGPSTSLHFARGDHTATLLSDGSVLVVGGYGIGGGALDSAELYQDATTGAPGTPGTWTVITSGLSAGRGDHTATLLANPTCLLSHTCKVLVAAGSDGLNDVVTAELYDPVSRTWSITGKMITPRTYHTATLLTDGKVLMVGGSNNNSIPPTISNAEIYDPSTGLWTATASMTTPRYSHTATLLNNGRVLVAGGFNGFVLNTAEIYDPATGSWTLTGSLGNSRYSHTATLLSNGNVLVAGGVDAANTYDQTSAEIYDSAIGSWTPTGALVTARHNHTATLITSGTNNLGKVLVIGGANELLIGGLKVIDLSIPSAEWYGGSTWTQSAVTGRVIHTATELTTGINVGKVLVVGGNATISGTTTVLSSVELLN